MVTTVTLLTLTRVRIIGGHALHEVKLADGRWVGAAHLQANPPAII